MIPKVMWQQYVGEVGKSITVMLQINSVHCMSNKPIVESDQHL